MPVSRSPCVLLMVSVTWPACWVLPRDGGQQQRPAGDRLAMMLADRRAGRTGSTSCRSAPPCGEQPAACQILRGEAAPAPLVLQLVERVLAVGPIAIQLPERQDLVVQRGDQGGVFPELAVRPDLGKAEQRLRGVAAID